MSGENDGKMPLTLDQIKGRWANRRAKCLAVVKNTMLGAERDGRASFGLVSGEGRVSDTARTNLRICSRRVVDDLQHMLEAAYNAGVADAIAQVATGEPRQPRFKDWWLHEEAVDWVEI